MRNENTRVITRLTIGIEKNALILTDLGLIFFSSSSFFIHNCHLKFENYRDRVCIIDRKNDTVEEFDPRVRKNMNFLHSVREQEEFHGKYSLSFRATS